MRSFLFQPGSMMTVERAAGRSVGRTADVLGMRGERMRGCEHLHEVYATTPLRRPPLQLSLRTVL